MRTLEELETLLFADHKSPLQEHAAKSILVSEMRERFNQFLAHMRSKGINRVVVQEYHSDTIELYPVTKLLPEDFDILFGLWRPNRGFNGFGHSDNKRTDNEWFLYGSARLYDPLVGEYEL